MQTAVSLYLAQRNADFLIAVKHTRGSRFRLIRDRLAYARKVPLRAAISEVGHGPTRAAPKQQLSRVKPLVRTTSLSANKQLSCLELDGVLIQADALHTLPAPFSSPPSRATTRLRS